MRDLRLPKFDKNRRINQQKVLVFDNNNIKNNIILGTNFLFKTEMKLNYSEGNMEWFDCSIPLYPPGGLDLNNVNEMEDMFHIQVKDELFGEDWLECFATEILDAKYDKTDVAEVVKRTHSSKCTSKSRFASSATGNGFYPHKKVHIDIDPNAKPVHSRPYPLP